MADEQTTSYSTPFGHERDRRNAHLDALPGGVYRRWFDALNNASRVVSGNGVEFNDHVQKFVGVATFANQLPEGFGFEAARLLHNYLAAMTTFRDIQRVMHRRVWPELYAPGTKDKRTTWEVHVWTPKVAEFFGDEEAVFLVDLRNYSLHYAIPLVSMGTNFRSVGGAGGPLAITNNVGLDRDELLKWEIGGPRAATTSPQPQATASTS